MLGYVLGALAGLAYLGRRGGRSRRGTRSRASVSRHPRTPTRSYYTQSGKYVGTFGGMGSLGDGLLDLIKKGMVSKDSDIPVEQAEIEIGKAGQSPWGGEAAHEAAHAGGFVTPAQAASAAYGETIQRLTQAGTMSLDAAAKQATIAGVEAAQQQAQATGQNVPREWGPERLKEVQPPPPPAAKQPPAKDKPKTGVVYDPQGRLSWGTQAQEFKAAYGPTAKAMQPMAPIDLSSTFAAWGWGKDSMPPAAPEPQQEYYAAAPAPAVKEEPLWYRRAAPTKGAVYDWEKAPEGQRVALEAKVAPLYSEYAQRAYDRELTRLEDELGTGERHKPFPPVEATQTYSPIAPVSTPTTDGVTSSVIGGGASAERREVSIVGGKPKCPAGYLLKCTKADVRNPQEFKKNCWCVKKA